MKEIDNFKKYMQDDYYTIYDTGTRAIVLKEESDNPYEFVLNVGKDDLHVHFRLDKIKDPQVSKYLKIISCKDCDDILIDLKEHIIYYIELKDTSSTTEIINKKISASKKWIEHLLFCIHLDHLIDETWTEVKLLFKYKDRKMQSLRNMDIYNDGHEPVQKTLYDIKICTGKYFILKSLITCC